MASSIYYHHEMPPIRVVGRHQAEIIQWAVDHKGWHTMAKEKDWKRKLRAAEATGAIEVVWHPDYAQFRFKPPVWPLHIDVLAEMMSQRHDVIRGVKASGELREALERRVFATEFDGFELNTCFVFEDPNSAGGTIVEAESEFSDEVIEVFWTIYGHCKAGGVESLFDFSNRLMAEAFLEFLEQKVELR